MVMASRHARQRIGARPLPARRGDQPGLVEESVALQHELLVPAAAGNTRSAFAEIEGDALPPLVPHRRLGRRLDPLPEPRQDCLGDERRRAATPILPREIAVPATPSGVMRACRMPLTGETEIADRDDMAPDAGLGPVAIGEGIELLDIAERMMGLSLDPGA